MFYQLPTDILPPAFPSGSPSQIERKIEKLRKTSVCPLDIPFPLISSFSGFLSKPLSVILNEIIQSGQYPHIWKQGFITPLQKKDGKPSFEGVRLISLTPIFSRRYEGFLAD